MPRSPITIAIVLVLCVLIACTELDFHLPEHIIARLHLVGWILGLVDVLIVAVSFVAEGEGH